MGAPAPLPVQLISSPPANKRRRFPARLPDAGRPAGNGPDQHQPDAGWMDVTNFIGDGSVQSVRLPDHQRARRILPCNDAVIKFNVVQRQFDDRPGAAAHPQRPIQGNSTGTIPGHRHLSPQQVVQGYQAKHLAARLIDQHHDQGTGFNQAALQIRDGLVGQTGDRRLPFGRAPGGQRRFGLFPREDAGQFSGSTTGKR